MSATILEALLRLLKKNPNLQILGGNDDHFRHKTERRKQRDSPRLHVAFDKALEGLKIALKYCLNL